MTETDKRHYAHPERLVSTEWVAEHLDQIGIARPDGSKLMLVECSEDVLLYEMGHIPGAVKLDWHTELNDPVTRDYVEGEDFAALLSSKGIGRKDTVVIYGDQSNWWAAYALWVFTLFGHADVRLMDGGRSLWVAEGRALVRTKPSFAASEYPVVERVDEKIRAFMPEVQKALGHSTLIDVRSPEEYTGARTHMPDYPQEGALRGGHIPTAVSVPWKKAANEDGTFRSRAELAELYETQLGLDPDADLIAYCRIGERSSHTWFVLAHLLGFRNVRNYDGSWTEWGNAVRAPIAQGSEPGELRRSAADRSE